MDRKRPSSGTMSGQRRRAVTMLELLVVIATLALMISILVPTLRGAFAESQSVRCASNLRSIVHATLMYFDSQGKVIPWYRIPTLRPGTDYTPLPPPNSGTPNLITPWVFGGFPSPSPANDGYIGDYAVYPAEVRPLNKYVDPTARGKDTIGLYIDPGDQSCSTVIIGQAPDPSAESVSSWQRLGSSYTLNARWAQGYAYPASNWPSSAFDTTQGAPYARAMVPYLMGGSAAQFIIWAEHGFYTATYNAGPTTDGINGGGSGQRMGWHGKWSSWVVGFADGHVRSGYFDTRQIYGLDGTIWQPGYKLPP